MNFIMQHPTETIFVLVLVIYAVLLGFVTTFYMKSEDQKTADENLPKSIKHITAGFVSIIVFLFLFYLASTGALPRDVLITLVSVFATAGFLSFRNKE